MLDGCRAPPDGGCRPRRRTLVRPVWRGRLHQSARWNAGGAGERRSPATEEYGRLRRRGEVQRVRVSRREAVERIGRPTRSSSSATLLRSGGASRSLSDSPISCRRGWVAGVQHQRAGRLRGLRGSSSLRRKNGATIGTLIVSVCMENDLRAYEGPEVVTATPEIGDVKAFLSEHSATYFLVTTALHGRRGSCARRSGLAGRSQFRGGRGIGHLGCGRALVVAAPRAIDRGTSCGGPDCSVAALWVGTEQHRRQAARTHERFIRLLEQGGLAVVDVRERFERGGHPLANHFATDGHWNAAGHRLAADALEEYFRGASIFRSTSPPDATSPPRGPSTRSTSQSSDAARR